MNNNFVRIICFVTMIFMFVACNNSKQTESDIIDERSDKFVGSFDVDSSIKSDILEQVSVIFDGYRSDFPNYKYSDWRIIDLENVYTYEELEGMEIEVFRVGFELYSDQPNNVMLVGGMYITEDNWVCPTYPNSTYFIYEKGDLKDDRNFIFTIMENDCSPGSETFTDDLIRKLKSEYI